jgi:GNAT superfamily N-acetyltransferase
MPLLEPFAPSHHRDGADVIADAFLDDPGWTATGPRGRRALRTYIHRTCLGAIRVADRWGGPSWCMTDGGRPVAVLTGFAPGLWPPPQIRALARLAPGPVLAGPATLSRSLRAERVFQQHHPAHDHFLVLLLAVSPAHQRRGLGGQLLRAAFARADAADVPAYLWTANPANVPYYRSHGFEVFAEAPIPGDVTNWFMERRPAEPPDGALSR